MLLRGAEARRFLAAPDPARAGLLLFGADAMRVALHRQQVAAALVGPAGEAEMRLIRLAASDLRRDGALLGDAIRERGFFPGQRVVLVEDAGDALAAPVRAALELRQEGDAFILLAAGSLATRSTLRAVFERDPRAVAVAIYDDPPGRDEIAAELERARLGRIEPAAMEDLVALAHMLEPGDFRQTLERIALYKLGDGTPLTPDEVAHLAPGTHEAGVDDLLDALTARRAAGLAVVLRRLEGQGVQPVALCIQVLRHLRALYLAASDPGGVQAGLARARIFGPRRDRMARELRDWDRRALETAIALVLETDLALRQSTRAPAMALLERALLRIAMGGRR